MIPIALRNYNRPVYLDLNLRSILASDLPNNIDIIVTDDCSTDELSQKYFNTNDTIKLKKPY